VPAPMIALSLALYLTMYAALIVAYIYVWFFTWRGTKNMPTSPSATTHRWKTSSMW